MDFVMAGNSEQTSVKLKYISDKGILAISTIERKGQKLSDGTELGTRQTTHHRLFKNDDGWQIISHLISDARSIGTDQYSNTEIEQEIIKKTIEYNQAWESVDMDSVAQFHDKDIRYYWHGYLASSSNEEFLKVFKEWMATTKAWGMEVENYDVQVLEKNIAIIGFNSSSSTSILTNEEKYDYGTGAFTFVWKKINGEWKIIHIHESSLEE